MNPLSFIPAGLQLYARLAALVLLVALGFGAAWKVKGALDGAVIADLKTQHALAIADAATRSQAQLKAAVAERDAKAAALSLIDQSHQEDLRRFHREEARVRADVAAGARVVRVPAAACPAGGNDVPQAGAGGGVDPGAAPVLSAAGGQAVFDLRASIKDGESALAACQRSLGCLTGQSACPATP